LIVAHIGFFAKDDDLIAITDAVENTIGLRYGLLNHFRHVPTSDAPILNTARDIPHLKSSESAMFNSPAEYLVLQTPLPFPTRSYLRDGKVIREIEYGNAPSAMRLALGGMWQNEILLGGFADTWPQGKHWGSNADSARLFRKFKYEVGKRFVRKRGWWLGPKAHEFLSQGGHLRQFKGPRDAYSLRIDEP
jgi:hypothetical protein